MLKNKLVNTQFVEEEFIIVVNHVIVGAERMMIIDSGPPNTLSNIGIYPKICYYRFFKRILNMSQK